MKPQEQSESGTSGRPGRVGRFAAALSALLLTGSILAFLAGYARNGGVGSRPWDLLLIAAATVLAPLFVLFGRPESVRLGMPALVRNGVAVLAGLATVGLIWIATDSQPAGPAVLVAAGVVVAILVAFMHHDGE